MYFIHLEIFIFENLKCLFISGETGLKYLIMNGPATIKSLPTPGLIACTNCVGYMRCWILETNNAIEIQGCKEMKAKKFSVFKDLVLW